MEAAPTIAAGHGRSAEIVRADRRDGLTLLGMTVPALTVIFLLLMVPVAWLFGLSLYEGGQLTGKHYLRLLNDPSYARSLWLTLEISVTVTALSILIGYPVSYLLSQLRPFWAVLGLTLVVIPFWTSLLVRTYAWLVLLQRQGLVNEALVGMGVIDEPLYLVHNVTGTIIGMLHIMLPFLILPLYANMRRIDTELVRAAASLGASPMFAFWKVYFPLSLPGLMAGSLLVLILSVGFYITPAILGGGRTIMIAMLIERNVNLFFEWGAASSVAVVFLAGVLGVFWLLNRFLAVERLFGER